MNENDLIAEYVREKYPEMLESVDFAVFRLIKAWGKMVNDFSETLKNIDFSKLTEAINAMKEGEENGES